LKTKTRKIITMKKILLLIPILGICSSLLAQAPQVLNVNANQVGGTKDVQIDFEITNKTDYSGELNVEVWYRISPDQTQWERAMSLWQDLVSELPNNIDWDAEAQQDVIYSHRIPAGGDSPAVRNIYWKAGEDAHDIKTDQAQVRVIVFYTKEGPEGAGAPTPKDQVSGWDGFDDGSTSGDTGGDTGGGGDGDGGANNGIPIYDLSAEQVTFLTAGSYSIPGFYTIEAIFDEDPNSANYGATSSGNVYAVHQPTPGEWVKEGTNYVGLDVANVPTKFALEDYLSTEALTPIDHLSSEESLF